MKRLSKILNITGVDVARFMGVTRQAVCQGSPKVGAAEENLIAAARFDQEKIELADKYYNDLKEFLGK
jgi:hypothetical protein